MEKMLKEILKEQQKQTKILKSIDRKLEDQKTVDVEKVADYFSSSLRSSSISNSFSKTE